MALLSQKLPLTYLLFTTRGRLRRSDYWLASTMVWCLFYVLYTVLNQNFGMASTWVLYPPFFWSVFALSSKRLHDGDKSALSLAFLFVPVAGPVYAFWQLLFRHGSRGTNGYGPSLESEIDYFKNDNGMPVGGEDDSGHIINDVTQINPVTVSKIVSPSSVEELVEIVRSTQGDISVGGGRFSMGGQTASSNSLHVDMRGLNRVLEFSKEKKRICIQTGIRWCDIQRVVDAHDLSVKTMQSYANFTVGGALSVNAHGRYVGLGPLILTVRSIRVLLADASLVTASKTENAEIFFAAIGGYNGIGIIVEAELDLADNVPVKLIQKKIHRAEYPLYFDQQIRGRAEPLFHNADMFPPNFTSVRSITWAQCKEKPTVETRLMPLREVYPIHRYFLWSFIEAPLGMWRREFIYEPLIYFRPKVHWRNYEAGYDVAELEPRSRKRHTFVLQEYFVPVAQFENFCRDMSEIFSRHDVKVLNISVRHAVADPGSYLAWAREEVFAFVVYYKQRTNAVENNRVAVWTRELVDAVIALGGSYYLPYQPHATPGQFHAAYPRAKTLFDLKARLDPHNRFRNVIWNTYYHINKRNAVQTSSEFKTVFDDIKARDAFYRFLQVVFHIYPEDKFHHLIAEVCSAKNSDEEIYKEVQGRLKEIKPFLSDLTYALPALKKQKGEMTRQTLELLGEKKEINGYMEIGSTGRYLSHLKSHLKFSGPIFIINDQAPNNSIGDIFERGQLAKLGTFIDLADYQPITADRVGDNCLDLVTIYIGFHHCPPPKLEAFIKSLHRALRPGGSLIVRDHDVRSLEMATFVSLVHTVFNLGLKVPWEKDHTEFKGFKSVDEWTRIICQCGFTTTGQRLFQEKDPSDNALLRFVKK